MDKEKDPKEVRYLKWRIERSGIERDLVKMQCPAHNLWYFHRVEGNIFECAHNDHHGGASPSWSRVDAAWDKGV